MEVVTFVNFMSIFFLVFGRIIRQEKNTFIIITIVLTLFYSIRTDYGSDIPAYINIFQNISYSSFSNLFNPNEHLEPGWIFLNWFFKPIGWQFFLFILTAIQFFTIYFIITRYTEKKYYWIVFSIYILNCNLLLTDLSMIRQALAMHITAWSIPFIIEKKYLKTILILFAATTIHTSAYVSFLLIPLPFLKNKDNRIITAVCLAVFIFFYIVEKYTGTILSAILNTDTFERYDIYEIEAKKGSGLGILLWLLTGIWLSLKYYNKNNYFFILVYWLYIITIPFSITISLVGRIGMYFMLISIVCYQNLTKIKKDAVGFILLLGTLYLNISGYFGFFNSPIWKESYAIYHTILD